MRMRAALLAVFSGFLMFLGLGFGVQMGWLPSAGQVQVGSVYAKHALGVGDAKGSPRSTLSDGQAQPGERRIASSSQSAESDIFEAVWNPAVQHVQKTWSLWRSLPQSCLTGETDSEFESRQCAEYWNDLVGASFYGFAPILVYLGFMIFVTPALIEGYRRIRRIVRRGKAAGLAKLDREVWKGFDLWAWLHCMRRIQVELAGGRRAVVYLPQSEPLPRKGTSLAIYPLGPRLGQKRYVAQLHLPHLAIIRGVRGR